MIREGEFYLLRDFTGDKFVARLVTIAPDELIFDHVAWVAASGVRDSALLEHGPGGPTEVEAYPTHLTTSWPRLAVRLTYWPHGAVKTQ